MIRLYHVSFHTAQGRPVFLADDADQSIQSILREVMKTHQILCLALEVMPTHAHMILVDFPDQDRGLAVKLLKGGPARRFLAEHPAFRGDLGDHLWQEGYYWREITSHQQ